MSYKTVLRKMAPALYTFSIRARHSDFVTRLESVGRQRAVHAEQRANNGYFAVNIEAKMGFGAMLSQLVAVLLYCDNAGLQPVVRFTNPLYSNQADGRHNWFEDFFEYLNPVPSDVVERLAFSNIRGQYDYSMKRLDDAISIQQAHDLSKAYFKIKPAAISEAVRFAQAEFSGKTLGLHYRGTDKKYESPRIQYDRMDDFLGKVVERISSETEVTPKIFVATDELKFLDHMNRGQWSSQIVYFDCKEFSAQGEAIHFSPGDNHRKGIEALSTMYLLSKCDWCVKTTSQLSAWAKILNPDLTVFTPQRSVGDFFHFPDKQIWESREQL